MFEDANELSSEALELTHLYENAEIGLCVTDAQHRYVRINQRLCDINGKSMEEHIGRTVDEVLPYIGKQIVSMFQSVMDSVEPIMGHEIRGLTAAYPGDERVFLGDHYPLLSKSGKALYVHTMVRDITAQRRYEAILEESNAELEKRVRMRMDELADVKTRLEAEGEKRDRVQIELERKSEMFQSLLQSSPDGIAIVDRGVILHANEQLLLMFGYAEKELLGKGIEQLVPDNVRGKHRGYREDYCRNPTARPMGARAALNGKRKDGSVFPADICIAPMTLDDVTVTACFVRDVTARKRVEEEVRLQQGKMHQIAKLSLMGELTGSIAHEIAQPLAGILSNVQAMELLLKDDNGPDEEIGKIVGDIVSDTKRAADVIRNLRGLFSRRNALFSPLSISLLIEGTVHILNSELVSQRVSVETNLAETLPLVIGNESQLQEVLINLILNAVQVMKETGQHGSSILIGADAKDPGEVRVWVEDNGPGIAPEMMDCLFESFTTSKKEGMGMGLSICKSIIKAHRGNLQVENKPGGGAKFQFKVPANTGEQTPAAVAVPECLEPLDSKS